MSDEHVINPSMLKAGKCVLIDIGENDVHPTITKLGPYGARLWEKASMGEHLQHRATNLHRIAIDPKREIEMITFVRKKLGLRVIL